MYKFGGEHALGMAQGSHSARLSQEWLSELSSGFDVEGRARILLNFSFSCSLWPGKWNLIAKHGKDETSLSQQIYRPSRCSPGLSGQNGEGGLIESNYSFL